MIPHVQPIKSVLRDTDRIHLIHSIINDAPLHLKGCRIHIEKYMSTSGAIKDYFPLHDYKRLNEIAMKWQSFFQTPKTEWYTSICIFLLFLSMWLLIVFVFVVYNIPYNRVKTQESCSIVTCMPCCFKKGGNTKICCCTAAQCFPASTYDNYTPVLVWPDIIERVRGNETDYS